MSALLLVCCAPASPPPRTEIGIASAAPPAAKGNAAPASSQHAKPDRCDPRTDAAERVRSAVLRDNPEVPPDRVGVDPGDFQRSDPAPDFDADGTPDIVLVRGGGTNAEHYLYLNATDCPRFVGTVRAAHVFGLACLHTRTSG